MKDFANDVRSRIALVARGPLPLHKFEDWFVRLFDAEDCASEDSQNLLSEVHLLLAEYSKGDLSREDLNSRLLILADGQAGSLTPRLDESSRSSLALAGVSNKQGDDSNWKATSSTSGSLSPEFGPEFGSRIIQPVSARISIP
jgi:hypothetical protein